MREFHDFADATAVMQPFGCNFRYFGRREKPDMNKVKAKLFTDLNEFLKDCDVVTINVPLSDKTRGMFNADTIEHMKDGAYLVNNARGAIVDAKAVSPYSSIATLSRSVLTFTAAL